MRDVTRQPALRCAGKSHPGMLRDNNEDRFYEDPARGIFIVIDGVGGQAAGEEAAEIALCKLRARLERLTGTTEERIREAVAIANNEIYRRAQQHEECRGMACVLTVAVVEDGCVTAGHVGDTRLYKLREGHVRKVSHDHSPVGEREDAGELSELEAMRHPRRNEVYRDVGTEPHEPDDKDFVEVINLPFEQDSALLFCSDGLSDMLTSSQILRIVEEHAGDPREVVEHLIDAANEAGGKDNVTALFVEGEQYALTADGGRWRARGEGVRAGGLAAPRRSRLASPPRRWPPLASRWAMLGWGVLLGTALSLLVAGSCVQRRAGAGSAVTPDPPRPARAGRLFVGEGEGADYRTVGEALARAEAGDVIVVAPGVYAERIELKEGVTVISPQPLAAVIVFPPEAEGRRVAVSANGVSSGRFMGFRIVGDARHPLEVGLRLIDSGVEVEGTEVTGAVVAGVEISGGNATLIGNRIHGNAGGGVLIVGGASPALVNNLILSNGKGAGAARRPGVEISGGGSPLMLGNLIAGNGAQGVAGVRAAGADEVERRNFFGGDVTVNGRGKLKAANGAAR